jgi:hypothetical protein
MSKVQRPKSTKPNPEPEASVKTRRGTDRERDTPELAALVREGVRSRHAPHRSGDVRKLLGRFRRRTRA